MIRDTLVPRQPRVVFQRHVDDGRGLGGRVCPVSRHGQARRDGLPRHGVRQGRRGKRLPLGVAVRVAGQGETDPALGRHVRDDQELDALLALMPGGGQGRAHGRGDARGRRVYAALGPLPRARLKDVRQDVLGVEEDDVHDALVAGGGGEGRAVLRRGQRRGAELVDQAVLRLAAGVPLGDDELALVVLPEDDPALELGVLDVDEDGGHVGLAGEGVRRLGRLGGFCA